MSKEKPKAGERGGAPFKTPGKSTKELLPSQLVVALSGELKQLTTDLEAIASGQAGSTFAKGDKAKLKTRIAKLKSILATLSVSSGTTH